MRKRYNDSVLDDAGEGGYPKGAGEPERRQGPDQATAAEAKCPIAGRDGASRGMTRSRIMHRRVRTYIFGADRYSIEGLS